LAPPYYSQRAVFASPLSAFFIYHCFCPSAAMNLHILFVHDGMTGRYHNETH